MRWPSANNLSNRTFLTATEVRGAARWPRPPTIAPKGARDDIAELVGLTAQLESAATQLGTHTAAGACDERCGCRTEPNRVKGSERQELPLADVEAGEIACTLGSDQLGDRIDDWNTLLAGADHREPIPYGIRMAFPDNADVATIARLSADEQACCGFFTFSIGIGGGMVTLDVTGGENAQPVITALFGVAA
ncbi:MAG: hypothetical protein GEU79_11570 [Acidimicrobiia bacterium]|nr:hypothetical protein [Acidimicrobiia bacterium]